MKKNTPRRASTYQRTNATITNSMQVTRSFIANEPIKRRDIKFVRSTQHQEECAEILFNFLSNKNYERETEELENEIEKLHKIKLTNIENLKKEKEIIDEKLQAIKYNDNSDIKNSNEDIKRQLEKLKRTVEKIPQKLEFFSKTISSSKSEISELNIEKLKSKRDKLQEQINNQTIKPEEIIEINKIKEELNERIKEIKKRKEKLSRENIKSEQEIFDHQSDRDALCHEISILNTSNNIIDSFEETDKIKEFRIAIENEICDLKKSLLEFDDKLIFFKQKNKDILFETDNLKNESELLNNKLLALGKLYLEKRSQFENEIFKFKKEIESINGKILQMELDSRYSLLNLEEQLESAKITYDSLEQKLKEDERETENFLSKAILEIEMKFEELDLLENEYQKTI